jgi:hypothetical protein
MGTFPGFFNQYKLEVDKTYLVCSEGRIRKAKLVRTTKRGFNFENIKTGKLLFNHHLYPLENIRDNVKNLTFQLIKTITIDKE